MMGKKYGPSIVFWVIVAFLLGMFLLAAIGKIHPSK